MEEASHDENDPIVKTLKYLDLAETSTPTPCDLKSGTPSAITNVPPSSNFSLASFDTPETSDSSDSESLPPAFTIRSTPSHTLALFTTRRIRAGALVLSEAPLFSLHSDLENDSSAIEAAFSALPKADRKTYLALFDAQKSRMSQVASIYYSNCYNKDGFISPDPNTSQDEGGSCIGPLSSRINHSCVPNAVFSYLPPSSSSSPESSKGQMRFHAIKNIPSGKEILCNYEKNIFRTREQRRQRMVMYYGFKCDCEACVPKSEFWERSDDRRRQMRECVMVGKRCEWEWERIVSESSDRDSDTEEKARLKRDVCGRAIEALLKLEGLLLRESLVYTPLANAYRTLGKWSERAGKKAEVRQWKENELKVCVTCLGGDAVRSCVLRRELDDDGGEEHEHDQR